MAQRRVNLPFVGLVLGGIVVLLIALAAAKILVKKDPAALMKQAHQLLQQPDLTDDTRRKAAEMMARASSASPHDMSIKVEYANLLMEIGRNDDQAMRDAYKMYNLVLQEDPTNKDALKPILHYWVGQVEFGGRPESFTALKETAEKVLKVDPAAKQYADAKTQGEVQALRQEAAAYQRIAVIGAWLQNIVTPEATLNENLQGLDDMLKADIASGDPERLRPDVPYFLCMGYWKQASEARTLGTEESKALAVTKEKLAYSTFDEAVKKAPDNPAMNVRFYQVLRFLSVGQDDDGKRGDRPDYVKRMYEVLSHARDVVRDGAQKAAKENKLYDYENSISDVYTSFSEFLQRNATKLATSLGATAQLPKPLELIGEWYSLRPGDQEARLEYSRQLVLSDPKNRPKAIELLQKDITDLGENSKLRPRNRRMLELTTYGQLIDLLLEQWTITTEPAKREDLRKQVEAGFQKLTERDTDGYATALYRGEIALHTKPGADGAIEAIPELERARDLRKQFGRGAAETHQWKLETMLAEAYARGNQTGLARTQLYNVVHWWPDMSGIGPRKALARLLISDRSGEEAAEQAKEIRRLLGSSAESDNELKQIENALLVVNKGSYNAKDIEKTLAGMPENTPLEVHNKISVSLVQQKVDDVARLYEKMRQDQKPWPGPADVETVRSLVQIYMSQGKKEQAIKVSDESLAKDKDNIALRIVRAQLDQNTPEVDKLTRQGIDSMKDPLDREVAYYEYARSKNLKAEALTHLDAAEKLAPENPKILDMRFQQLVMDNKLDEAEGLIAKLADKNFDEAHGLIYKYRLAMMRNRIQDAQDVVDEMIQTLPQYARSWVYAGDLLQRQKKYRDAVSRYLSALERQNGNMDALRGLVLSYLAMQPAQQDDAWQYIKQGRQLFPGDPWFREQEISWQLTFAPEKAIEPREREAKANPDQLGPQIALYAAYWELGKQQLQKGKFEEAKVPMQKAHDGFGAVLAKWPEQNELEYAYYADICTQTGDYAGGEKALKDFYASAKWKDSPKPPMLLAEYYARAGKNDVAEAAYNEALARSKNAPDVRSRVSRFYLNQRKYDQAIAALDASSPDRAVQDQLIQTYVEAGKLTAAEKALAKLREASPNDAMLLVTQGMLQLQEAKLPAALASLAAALAIDPHNSAAYYYQGLAYMRQGSDHRADAIKALTAARDSADTTNVLTQVQSRMMLGEVLRANGQPEEGAAELIGALQIQPGNKDLRMRLIDILGSAINPRWSDVETYIRDAQKMPEFKTDPDWWRVEASMWATRKQDDRALAAIRQALDLAKGQPQRVVPLMQDYVTILTRLEKFPELEAETTELLSNAQIAQNGWWVFQARGTAIARQGRKDEALGEFDKALAITARLKNDEATMQVIQEVANAIGINQAIKLLEDQAKAGDDRWRVIMVDLYLRQGDVAHAEAKADAVLAEAEAKHLKPDEMQAAYSIAGMAFMSAGHYEKAKAVYEKLLAATPDDTIALNNLACINVDFLNPRNPQKALEYSQRAYDVLKKNGIVAPDLMDTYGWVLSNNGRVDEGISILQQALEQRPIMEAHYHLGVAMMKKALGPEAQVQLMKAQKMLDDRKHKGQPVDPKIEASIADALAKAKVMANGPSAGTQEPVKP